MVRPKVTRPPEESILFLTHKLYIKDLNESCFFKYYKLKSIGYAAFFKRKELSAALKGIIVSINVSKKSTMLIPQLLQVS